MQYLYTYTLCDNYKIYKNNVIFKKIRNAELLGQREVIEELVV
jgi:hypothetical protein